MSPEIMNNSKYNSKTDIWSLGVILYELVCLRLPFQGNSMKQLCYNIINATPSPPPSSFSTAMKELLRDILAKDARKRPSINHILSKNLIKDRISNYLNETKIQKEFSHTILHGVNVLSANAAPVSVSSPSVPSQQPVPSKVVPVPSSHNIPAPSNAAARPQPIIQNNNQNLNPAAIAARYKVMGNPVPAPVQQQQQQPKSVDQILRNMLKRDPVPVQQQQPKPQSRPSSANSNIVNRNPPSQPTPSGNKPASAAININNRLSDVQQKPFSEPVKIPLHQNKPVVVRPSPVQVLSRPNQPVNANPFEIIVEKAPVISKQPLVKPQQPQYPITKPQIPVVKPRIDEQPNRYQPKDAVASSNVPIKGLKVLKENPPAVAPQAMKQQPPPPPSSALDNYRSPKVALQQRNVESGERAQKIDDIIEKAAAVLDVIKKERIKAENRLFEKSPPPYHDLKEKEKFSGVPSEKAGRLQSPAVNSAPVLKVDSNNIDKKLVDMPWLANLQNQMGVLKVQVQKMQENRQSPATNDSENNNYNFGKNQEEPKSKPVITEKPSAQAPIDPRAKAFVLPRQNVPGGENYNKPASAPVKPTSRQSFPLEKNSNNNSNIARRSPVVNSSGNDNKKGGRDVRTPQSVSPNPVAFSNKNNKAPAQQMNIQNNKKVKQGGQSKKPKAASQKSKPKPLEPGKLFFSVLYRRPSFHSFIQMVLHRKSC
jgi:hypothetical protein